MSEIGKYLQRARASQRAGFGLPIVQSADDAVRVVREAAAELEGMAAAERLSLLSDLRALSDLLAGQIDRLNKDMAETGQTLHQIRASRRALNSYAQSANAPYRSAARH